MIKATATIAGRVLGAAEERTCVPISCSDTANHLCGSSTLELLTSLVSEEKDTETICDIVVGDATTKPAYLAF